MDEVMIVTTSDLPGYDIVKILDTIFFQFGVLFMIGTLE
jgi:hypothetical protein